MVLPELGAAFDVGEQEGDRAFGQGGGRTSRSRWRSKRGRSFSYSYSYSSSTIWPGLSPGPGPGLCPELLVERLGLRIGGGVQLPVQPQAQLAVDLDRRRFVATRRQRRHQRPLRG